MGWNAITIHDTHIAVEPVQCNTTEPVRQSLDHVCASARTVNGVEVEMSLARRA